MQLEELKQRGARHHREGDSTWRGSATARTSGDKINEFTVTAIDGVHVERMESP
jgi:hypothetical protein